VDLHKIGCESVDWNQLYSVHLLRFKNTRVYPKVSGLSR
jgi:hypothetical protein